MLQLLRDHGPHITKSMFDTHTSIAAGITTAGTVAIATVDKANEASAALTLNEWSMIAVIFSASATGIVMALKAISEFMKIRKELKNKDD